MFGADYQFLFHRGWRKECSSPVSDSVQVPPFLLTFPGSKPVGVPRGSTPAVVPFHLRACSLGILSVSNFPRLGLEYRGQQACFRGSASLLFAGPQVCLENRNSRGRGLSAPVHSAE